MVALARGEAGGGGGQGSRALSRGGCARLHSLAVLCMHRSSISTAVCLCSTLAGTDVHANPVPAAPACPCSKG